MPTSLASACVFSTASARRVDTSEKSTTNPGRSQVPLPDPPCTATAFNWPLSQLRQRRFFLIASVASPYWKPRTKDLGKAAFKFHLAKSLDFDGTTFFASEMNLQVHDSC